MEIALSSEGKPFLGPSSFERGRSPYFFGREEEIVELTSLISSRRCVFVYARSGAGKTSLMNAGVIPELEKREFRVLPVARVSGAGSPSRSVRNVYAQNAALCWDPNLGPEQAEGLTIEEAVASFRVGAPRRGCVVIFDQFEELTTHYPDRWQDRSDLFRQVASALGVGRAILKDHAELLRDLGPSMWKRAEAREAIAELSAHDSEIPAQLEAWASTAQAGRERGAGSTRLSSPPALAPYLEWQETHDLRFVFVMREDYLASIESYSSALSGGMRARLRIDPLRHEQAKKAIAGPFEEIGRPLADTSTDFLVSKLAAVRTQESVDTAATGEFIEPTHLQISCMTLWRDTAGDSKPITKHRIIEIDPVGQGLERFYEEAISGAAKRGGVSESSLRLWVEGELITEAHTRATVFRGATHSARMKAAAVAELDVEGLVRPVERAGASWYELTHDALIEPIFRSNRAAERVALSIKNRWTAVLVIFGLVAVFSVWFVKETERQQAVDDAEEITRESAIKVQKLKEEEELERVKLEQNVEIAEEMASEANKEATKQEGLLFDEKDLGSLQAVPEPPTEELIEQQVAPPLFRGVDPLAAELVSPLEKQGIERLGASCPLPGICTEAQRQSSEQQWQRAIRLREKNRLHQAIALYNRAREICPSNPRPYNSLGAMVQVIVGNKNLDQDRFDTAREYYECALHLDPRYEAAHSNLSGLLFHWSKKALSSERQVLRDRARREAARGGRGKTARRVRAQLQTTEARYEARALWNKGQAAFEAGDRRKAKKLYIQSNKRDPDYAPAYNSLGRMDLEGGDAAGAQVWFEKALDKDSNYSPAGYNLVLALTYQEEFSDADEALKEAKGKWKSYAQREAVEDRLETEREKAER